MSSFLAKDLRLQNQVSVLVYSLSTGNNGLKFDLDYVDFLIFLIFLYVIIIIIIIVCYSPKHCFRLIEGQQ